MFSLFSINRTACCILDIHFDLPLDQSTRFKKPKKFSVIKRYNDIKMHSQQSMIIAIYAVALSLAITAVNGRYTNKEECEPVRMKMCNDLDPANYIYTSFPNFMNHSSSEVAEKELSRYTDIIESGCSSVLQMFLCSLYIPICKPRIGKRIPPCRSLCQEARSGCEPLLNSAHIRWPHSMSCDHFPEENSGELCISLPDPQPAVKTIDEVEANRIPSKRTTIRKGKYLLQHKPILLLFLSYYHTFSSYIAAKYTS